MQEAETYQIRDIQQALNNLDLPQEEEKVKEVDPLLAKLYKASKESGEDKLKFKFTKDIFHKVRAREKRSKAMKLYFTLSKDESEVFRNYCELFKSEDMHMNDFVKFLFLTGVNTYSSSVQDAVKELAEDPEALKAAGLAEDDSQEENGNPESTE